MENSFTAQNTDKELWRSKTEDGVDSYYAKHKLFVTESGAIGLCEVSYCIVLPPEEWFKLATGGKSWNEMISQFNQPSPDSTCGGGEVC